MERARPPNVVSKATSRTFRQIKLGIVSMRTDPNSFTVLRTMFNDRGWPMSRLLIGDDETEADECHTPRAKLTQSPHSPKLARDGGRN